MSRVGASGASELVVQGDRSGHYVVLGTVNGVNVEFLLDTGATDVAIPPALARRLKLIDITVRFSEPVAVDTCTGTPFITISLDGTRAREAPYRTGAGTDTLTFTYRMRDTDADASSILIEANAIRANAGSTPRRPASHRSSTPRQAGSPIRSRCRSPTPPCARRWAPRWSSS